MKFTTVAAFVFTSALAVSARPASETNAQRMARGLPPLAPHRRATGVETAKRSTSSGISYSCNTGPVQCCNTVTSSNSKNVQLLAGLIGAVLPAAANVLVGMQCHPLSVVGVGGNSCNSQPVCCENNEFNGLINIGCTPITVNL
ncbi:fungal hydrophobin-domain-containing protein [Panaeolus papilionaceus]|nr:fungal hydrophobin-domain-containing protein [Panaeolus papilionaceus]